MAHDLSSLDTAHTGPIHAAQLDHFGRHLATASEDQIVRIWAILDVEVRRPVAQLIGHTAPVLAVSWSHPKFGPLLASGGEDRKVLVWRGPPLEESEKESESAWGLAYSHEVQGEALAVSFGPWEYGLQLAVASSDGQVSVYSLRDESQAQAQSQILRRATAGSSPLLGPSLPPLALPGSGGEGSGAAGSAIAGDNSLAGVAGAAPAATSGAEEATSSGRWQVENFIAHQGGCFCLCWAPAASPVTESSAGAAAGGGERRKSVVLQPRRLVTGGADQQVRIWRHDVQTNSWADSHHFPGDAHSAWIRDVAWRPNAGIPANTIASCAEDGTVVIWTQAMVGQPWEMKDKKELHGAAAWQVSWSVTGSVLAVTSSNNQVLLFKEQLDGNWTQVEMVGETGSALLASPANEAFRSMEARSPDE
mmetsp:Transcript_99022/g.284626  ORF Transcript_99022/g.284626 Transcript_99022/m.284626 type:complete len:420 (+) Transcript_99022:173-1432(+)